MLWHKAWLETLEIPDRLALLVCSACFLVLSYPFVQRLLSQLPNLDVAGAVGRQLRQRADLLATYRGYVWSQWFGQNMAQAWTLCAVIIGTGGLLHQASRGALYTLSMPVSRHRLLGVRASLSLAELFALAFVLARAPRALAARRAELRHRGRRRARRGASSSGFGVLQPGVPAVHRVQRRLAPGAHHAPRRGRPEPGRTGAPRSPSSGLLLVMNAELLRGASAVAQASPAAPSCPPR